MGEVVRSTEYAVPSTEERMTAGATYPVLRTRYSVLGTWYCVLRTRSASPHAQIQKDNRRLRGRRFGWGVGGIGSGQGPPRERPRGRTAGTCSLTPLAGSRPAGAWSHTAGDSSPGRGAWLRSTRQWSRDLRPTAAAAGRPSSGPA